MWKKLGKLALAMLLLIFSVQYVFLAQETTPDLKKEFEELRKDQKALHEELKMIKNLLLKGPMPIPSQANVRNVKFDLGNNPIKGHDSAPLVIVEFTDYQCSFCARHTKETYPEIYKKYIDTGKLRYVIMDKPLPSHNRSTEAAEAAHCAYEQEKFWEMHDEMIFNPESLNDLVSIASFVGLDIPKFKNCMETKKYAGKVTANLSLANKLNVPSVPGFVIASSDLDNPQKVKGISYIRGAKPFTRFQQEIDKALADLTD